MLRSIEYFRALAIIFIVAGHFFYISDIKPSGLFEQTIQNIIYGGTSLFVFISGFLFHHVFYNNFCYKLFLKKKIKVIVLPYLAFSSLPVVYYTMKNVDSYLYFDIGFLNYIALSLKYLVTGSVLEIYWYIPFIMLIFLLSPLFIVFISLPFSWKIFLITTLLIIACLMHRPLENYNAFQSLLYFSPVFLIGIAASIYKKEIYDGLNNKVYYLLGVVLLLALVQAYSGSIGSYHKAPFEYNGLDLMLIQKITLSFFLLAWLHKFEHTKNKLLCKIAATSFTIYFMHALLLWITLSVSFKLNGTWLLYILLVAAVVAVCVFSALVIKKIIPSYSRYLSGY